MSCKVALGWRSPSSSVGTWNGASVLIVDDMDKVISAYLMDNKDYIAYLTLDEGLRCCEVPGWVPMNADDIMMCH